MLMGMSHCYGMDLWWIDTDEQLPDEVIRTKDEGTTEPGLFLSLRKNNHGTVELSVLQPTSEAWHDGSVLAWLPIPDVMDFMYSKAIDEVDTIIETLDSLEEGSA